MKEAGVTPERRQDALASHSGHERDPEAIDFSSPEAAGYAQKVEALGRATHCAPVAQLAYGQDRGQRLDVYAPPEAEALPILLFFHGGAWINGHLGWLRFMAPLVTALPAIFVAGTYRLAPRCRWPAQFEDVIAACAKVREAANRFGGDPERVAVGGHSAGGHLAALLTLQNKGGSLLGCLPVSAPFDLQHGEVPLESHEGRVYRYLFNARSQDREASPVEYVREVGTPFHIVWGERDLKHVATSSEAMVQALRRAGSRVSHSELPAASHFDTHLRLADPLDAWYTRLRELLA